MYLEKQLYCVQSLNIEPRGLYNFNTAGVAPGAWLLDSIKPMVLILTLRSHIKPFCVFDYAIFIVTAFQKAQFASPDLVRPARAYDWAVSISDPYIVI